MKQEIDNKIIKNKVRDNQKTTFRSIQKGIEEEFGVPVSSRLVRCRLNQYDYYSIQIFLYEST